MSAFVFSLQLAHSICLNYASEVCALRFTETQEFWRYNALVVAMILFVRWCHQIRDYMSEHEMFSATIIESFDLEAYTEKTALTKNVKTYNA